MAGKGKPLKGVGTAGPYSGDIKKEGVKRISKAYACEHILHCSPATFDNYVRAGIIPKGKKEIGFNELSWSLKDFDGVKLQRIHKK